MSENIQKKINKKLVVLILVGLLLATGIVASGYVVASGNGVGGDNQSSQVSPLSGNAPKIQIYTTKFDESIYQQSALVQWASVRFYIPYSSYVNVQMSGTIGAADLGNNAYTGYILKTDDGQEGTVGNYYNPIWDTNSMMEIYTPISSYAMFHFNPGWHTVYLDGNSQFYHSASGGTSYGVSGILIAIVYPDSMVGN